MAQWEVVIGLETHVQLTTVSKIFSGSSTAFGAAPNTQASVVDLALPGALPVMNKGAVERAVKFGLAIGAKINQRSIFARKNYFYPDLPKGYQISQFETPIVEGGGLTITLDDGSTKFIELTRAHLEEDAGKSVHGEFDGATGVDLNRAGTPLLEIVTEPVMRSGKEAIAYAKTLHSLVRSLDICDGNMQEGSFRCDVNVSVRPVGQKEFGTRREIKNLNSFKFMQQAVDYEVRWQIEQIEDGHKIVQATVLFNPDTGETRAMRTKEDAMDYRYFPDPDLPPLVVSDEMLARIKSTMPELPEAKCARFVSQYALSEYDARLLSQDTATANFYEAATKAGADAKLVANWMLSDLSAALNRDEKTFDQSPVSSTQLAGLITRISDGTISNKIGKTVFEALWNGEGVSADAVIEAKGLKQISDSGAIEKIVDEVLAKSAVQIADFKSGKEKALMSIVGMVMKASAGKANPAQVNDIVRRKIAAL
ncbi:MAG: Asp-tRNA(Asn)/Glu-tRNA(Gln) amidotransferase subunit GatB [Casimicrobium sp.]